MEEIYLTPACLEAFGEHLIREEKAPATREKYLRDVGRFAEFACGRALTRTVVLEWKQQLSDGGYAARSVNAMLASVGCLLKFLKLEGCRVKHLRLQRSSYCSEDKSLSKAEYCRLVEAADPRLKLILQTMCATGIRVSELRHFTVEALGRGEVTVRCKGKTRTILLPSRLRKLLGKYARQQGIRTGPLFPGSRGKALDRSSIWRMMKGLCAGAGVAPGKVFPPQSAQALRPDLLCPGA